MKLSELGTPATQTRFVNNTAGAPFGLQLRLSQTGPMRPRDTTPIPGLYTVGTSTAWGPGTVGAMLSGVNAAGSIIGRDLVPFIRSGANSPIRLCCPNGTPTSTRSAQPGHCTSEGAARKSATCPRSVAR